MKGSQFQQLIIFAINLLWASHRNLVHWPIEFIRIYIDDGCKNRDWVDHPLCVNFSANIRNRFRTRPIPEERQVWAIDNLVESEPTETPTLRFDDTQQTEDTIQVSPFRSSSRSKHFTIFRISSLSSGTSAPIPNC